MNHVETFENWKRFQLLEREDVAMAEKWKGIAKGVVDQWLKDIVGTIKNVFDIYKTGSAKEIKSTMLAVTGVIGDFKDRMVHGWNIDTAEGEILFIVKPLGFFETANAKFEQPNKVTLYDTLLYELLENIRDCLVRKEQEGEALEVYDELVEIFKRSRGRLITNIIMHELIHYHDNTNYDLRLAKGRSNSGIEKFKRSFDGEIPIKYQEEFRALLQAAYVNSNWEYNAHFLQAVANFLDDHRWQNKTPKTYQEMESIFLGIKSIPDYGYLSDYMVQSSTPEQLKRIKKRLYDLWTKLKEVK